MATEPYKLKITCSRCNGSGLADLGLGNVECPDCKGDGVLDNGQIDGAEQIAELTTKLDAIKAMLDSPTLGMQKMSSNLDDIMVKLDV